MEAIPLPNQPIVKELGENKYNLILEPLYPGYGVTIGNALRRVLLSSLPGAAATSVKIKFADHEFSTIPHIKEDVIQIILNLKKLRFKCFSAEPVKVNLKVKGEKKATAADIKETDQVQVINKDLHIATLDSSKAELDMEIVVEQGRGYVPVESREKQKNELGMILVDAIYTPVKSVHFDVTNVRVGRLTNFDKLELFLETDGSLTGDDAVKIAGSILVDHFTMLLGTPEETAVEQVEPEEKQVKLEDFEDKLDQGENEIQNSTLSTRAKNALVKNGITSMAKLQELGSEEIAKLDGLGEKTVKEILEFLNQ